MANSMEVKDRNTGEVYEYEHLVGFESLQKLMADLMMDRIPYFAAMALVSHLKSNIYKRKLAIQDGLYNAYIDALDFDENSQYWKSTFSATKIRDKIAAENDEYKAQSTELDHLNALASCADEVFDTIKALERSAWGRYAERNRGGD